MLRILGIHLTHRVGVGIIPGRKDFGIVNGRCLEATQTALADQVAAAADMVAGQADEGRPVVRVRGLRFEPSELGADTILRPADQDLYA